MITRFDHAVIAVPELAEALEVYQRLGFEIAAGGRHPSLGTVNAIVRFGLDYLELLAVEDPRVARARGPFGAELAQFVSYASGLVGFVVASDALDDEAHGFKRVGIPIEGPFAMDRIRPDGRTLAWRLVLPGASPWRKLWPFLIEWSTSDAERLCWDARGAHANGACGVRELELVVDDLAAAKRVYEEALELVPRPGRADLQVTRYDLGAFSLVVSGPTDAERAQELARLGPGPFRLTLASVDLEQTAAVLSAAAVDFTRGREGIDIAPSRALGARLRFVG